MCYAAELIYKKKHFIVERFNCISNKGFIIDPTISMETDNDKFESVNREKKEIYDPRILYF